MSYAGELPQQVPEDSGLAAGDMAVQLLHAAPFAMVVTDASAADNPIVFVNDAFEATTGYSRDAALGRNCRFLQGPQTDRRTVERIRSAIDDGSEITVDILNYRADGTPFWNRLMIGPLRRPGGPPRFFFGVQQALGHDPSLDIDRSSDPVLRELQHRVKNHLAMVVGLIRLQSRGAAADVGFEVLARRVESLQLLYEELNASSGENRDAVVLGTYLSRIAQTLAGLSAGSNIMLDQDVEAFVVPLETAVATGMIVSELTTNVAQHAFKGRDGGRVRLSVHEAADGGFEVAVADDGIGLPEPLEWPNPGSLGGRLMIQLASSLRGRLTIEPRDGGGSVAILSVPASARRMR